MRIWVTTPAGTSLGHKKILFLGETGSWEIWRSGAWAEELRQILVRRNWQLGNLKAELHWGRS